MCARITIQGVTTLQEARAAPPQMAPDVIVPSLASLVLTAARRGDDGGAS